MGIILKKKKKKGVLGSREIPRVRRESSKPSSPDTLTWHPTFGVSECFREHADLGGDVRIRDQVPEAVPGPSPPWRCRDCRPRCYGDSIAQGGSRAQRSGELRAGSCLPNTAAALEKAGGGRGAGDALCSVENRGEGPRAIGDDGSKCDYST